MPGGDPVPPSPPPTARKATPQLAAPPKAARKGDGFAPIPPGSAQDKALDEQVGQLRTGTDPRARAKAAEAIGAIGPAAADKAAGPLCDALADPSAAVGAAALRAIELVRPDLYRPLSTLTLDAHPTNQERAVAELGLLADRATPCVNLLVAILRRQLAAEPAVNGLTDMQRALFTAVRQINPNDSATLAFYKAVAAPTSQFSPAKFEALAFLHGWAGPDAGRQREVLPFVRGGLADAHCQLACIRYLGEYGQVAKDCAAILRNLKLSSDARVREAAARSLERVDGGF